MKVAFFIGSLNRGGTETLLLDTFRNKEIEPFESILIYRNEGDLSQDYRETGVKLVRVKPNGFRFGYISRIRRVLIQEEVSILHTQTLLNAFIGLFCVLFLRTKLVVSFHGLFSSLKQRIITHFVIWCADASIFVSDYVLKWYFGHTLFVPKKRCYVVYNGVDFSKFDSIYPVPDFLTNNIAVSKAPCFRLAMVGNFVKGRSQYFVCKCLKKLVDDGFYGFQFYFIGKKSEAEPKLYEECVRYCSENGLSDNIHFLGSRSDVPAILQNIDCFVYSSNFDSFGIAVAEAIAVGLPVIVNDWDVMREITNNGKLAILYDSNNVNDCVEKIKSFFSQKDVYLINAKISSEIVRKRFSIENHVKALNRIYETTFL